ncbi:SDR family NAD(P)-dependent oxidoreductase [Streptomyces sp. NPDC004244]
MPGELFGAWRTARAFLPLLRRSARPRPVNVSSASGPLEHMSGGTPAHGVSKAALNALTRKLADKLRAERILVNTVCPGRIATDMGGPGDGPPRPSFMCWTGTASRLPRSPMPPAR